MKKANTKVISTKLTQDELVYLNSLLIKTGLNTTNLLKSVLNVLKDKPKIEEFFVEKIKTSVDH